MDLDRVGPGKGAPERITVVVEIPKGSRNKIEYDYDIGTFRLDRVLHASVHYPGDYGFIPGTFADDGDPLDVLVLMEEPTSTGCVLSVRPLGMLELTDEGRKDDKIVAVPVRDPRYEDVRDLGDLPSHVLTEIDHFFRIYKELEDKEISSLGWQPVEDAYRVIEEAIESNRDI